tara:strand:+ start:293 stop:1153 length:861 start_codon:yes stop_codon:yes gene_type:complete
MVFVLFTVSKTKAQVQENTILDRFNRNVFNPAYAGSEGKVIAFNTRSTWKGIADAPKTNYFMYSGSPKKNLSFGLSVISNKVFIDTRTQYALDASYKLKVGNKYNLFLGLKAGATTKNSDLDGLERITKIDNPAIAQTDKATFPVFGFGALLKSDKFYASVAIPNVLNPSKFVKDEVFISSEKPTVYFLTGTSIETGFFGSKVKPYFSVKIIPDSKNQTHIGGTFDFKNTVEVGGGLKSTGFMNVMLLVRTKSGISIAYAYDFGTPNGQTAVTQSGYEFLLKFNFK